MGFLFKKEQKSAPVKPDLTGLQIQTSASSLARPIIYGSPRVAPNLIWANGFHSTQTTTGGGRSGGKGLLSGGKGAKGGGTTTTTYYADVILAVGEGPMAEPIYVFRDQNVAKWSELPGDGINFLWYDGSTSQTADPTIASKYPAEAMAYRHTAYIFAPSYQLDSSGTVQQHNMVVSGLLKASCPLNNDAVGGFEDADPAQVIVDYLSSQFYGAGFPVALIDGGIFTGANGYIAGTGDSAYQTYCQAAGFGFSTAISNFEAASSTLGRWLQITNSQAVWNGESFKVIPYGDLYLDGNPGWDAAAGIDLKYYTPDLTPRVTFNDCDYIQTTDNSDPITIARKDPAAAYNVVRLTYQDRGLEYNDQIAEAPIDNFIELYGRRTQDISASDYTGSGYAYLAAQLIVQRNCYIRNIYTFKTTWEYLFLDPMDPIEIVESTLVPDGALCRIVSIEEGEDGLCTIEAEEV